MRQAGTITYWFCMGAGLFLVVLGLVRFMAGAMPGILLVFCLATAAVFALAGLWVLRRSAGSIE